MTRATRFALLVATAAAAAVVVSTVSAGSSTISTLSSWNGADNIGSFGKPDTSTYGQTLRVPSGTTVLNSFGFEMDIPGALTFRGEVYAWDGTKATGPNLWESAPRSTAGTGFELVKFAPNITVTPGERLIIFASISKDYAANPTVTGVWGAPSGDTYSAGGFMYENNGGSASDWTSTTWSDFGGQDLAFTAHFSAQAESARGGYCSVSGNTMPDGSTIAPGTFLDLALGQASDDANYKGAVPAAYYDGIGITCDNPPPGYTDTGTKVNSSGITTDDAIYEYWAKS